MNSKLLTTLFCCLLISGADLMSQAKQYSLFEHFTQASCGPCAQRNPIFQAVYENNLINAHHVAYHTSWPGVDPMNSINPDQVATLVSLYGVTGVPDMVQDGNVLGDPTAVSQGIIDRVPASPIRILVEQNNSGDTLVTGTVTIQVVGQAPTGTYKLKTMAVERDIKYNSPPGTNGERDFPNVFREFVLNGDLGKTIFLPQQGEEATYDFSYEMNSAWNPAEIYTLSYVQRSSSDVILNSGASTDPDFELFTTDDHYFKSAQSAPTTFESAIYSRSSHDMVVNFSTDASSEWSHTVMLNGSEVMDGDTISIIAGESFLNLNVDPGTASGISSYTITIKELGTDDAQRVSYFVINNVTDVVVVSDNSVSGTVPVDFGAPYLAGLEAASTAEKASMGHSFLTDAAEASALEDVQNIYYAIGWSFPALTDAVTSALKTHLDNGGNLFISGQDMGWDIMSEHAQSNGTAFQREFYTNYLKTAFIDDGAFDNQNFIANPDDDVYGSVPASTVNTVYTAANTYPDVIDPIGPDASTIFTYTSSTNAAVKVNTGTYKVVYLGIGLEQIADASVAEEIFLLTHDWFHGLVSTEYVDAAFAELGNAFPNPASESVNITFGETLKGDLDMQLTDVSGKVILSQPVAPGTSEISLDVSNLATGVYYYQLTNGQQITTAKKLVRK